jgi:hypothetical protein
MIMARDAGHRNWVMDLCRAHGFDPFPSQSAGDMVAGIVMASNGLGVQIVAASAQAMSLPGLIYRPLASRVPAYASMELQCAYLRQEASPLLFALLKIVRDFRKEFASTKSATVGASPRTRSRRQRK